MKLIDTNKMLLFCNACIVTTACISPVLRFSDSIFEWEIQTTAPCCHGELISLRQWQNEVIVGCLLWFLLSVQIWFECDFLAKMDATWGGTTVGSIATSYLMNVWCERALSRAGNTGPDHCWLCERESIRACISHPVGSWSDRTCPGVDQSTPCSLSVRDPAQVDCSAVPPQGVFYRVLIMGSHHNVGISVECNLPPARSPGTWTNKNEHKKDHLSLYIYFCL